MNQTPLFEFRGLGDILAVLETIRDTTTAEDTLEKIIEIADNIEIMRNAL